MLNRLQTAQTTRRPPLPRASSVNDPGDITFIFGIVRSYRRMIALAALAGLALGALYFALAPRQYTASSMVLIDFRRLSAIGESDILINFRVNDAAVESQTTILESEGLMRTVIATLGLADDPEFIGEPSWWTPWLAGLGAVDDPATMTAAQRAQVALEAFGKRLSAKRVSTSYVIEVKFKSRDAAKAMRVVNEVSTAYIRDQLNAKQEAGTSANDWFAKRIVELQKQAAEAETAAVAYRAKNQMMLADGKFVDEQQVSALADRIVSARVARAEAEAKFERVQDLLKTERLEGGVGDEFRNNVIISLRQKYFDLARRVAENAARYGEDHGSVVRMRADMAELKKSIAEEFRRIAETYRSDAAIARGQEESLTITLQKLADGSSLAQQARVELAQLDSVAQSFRTMRDNFLNRFTEASQEQTFPITEARVLNQASLPQRPSSPRALTSLGGGAIIGLGIGFAFALCTRIFSRAARTREQVETITGAPCLAFLPHIGGERRRLARQSRDPSLAPDADHAIEMFTQRPFGVFSEGLRSIDIAIGTQMEGHRSGGVVIGFVSALRHEGSSVIAANYAHLAAAAGNKTMLIDGDLRHRTLSRGLTPQAQHGLFSAYQDLATLPKVLSVTKGGVHFLPAVAGEAMLHPSEMFASPKMRRLLDVSRRAFGRIVIDLPPITQIVDARSIADLVDGYVLVVEWNRTSLEVLGEAMAANPQVARKLVGVAFNKVDLVAARRIGDAAALIDREYAEKSLLSGIAARDGDHDRTVRL